MTSLPILLPESYAPVVAIGTSVTVGQILAQSTTSDEIIVNIANTLHCSVKKVNNTIRKNPGDSVTKGDLLALKTGFFGISQTALLSNVTGNVVRFERDTGNLVIKTLQPNSVPTQTLLSPVDGVVKLCDNEQIVLDTDKNVLTGEKGHGATGSGEVFILEKSLKPVEKPEDNANLMFLLESNAIGKVLVGGVLPRDVIVKAIGMGLTGVVGTTIEDSDLEHIKERNLSTPVIQVNAVDIEKLLSWSGKKVFLDGESKSIVFLQL